MVSTGVLTVFYCGVLWKSKYLLNRFFAVDHNLEYLEFEDLLD